MTHNCAFECEDVDPELILIRSGHGVMYEGDMRQMYVGQVDIGQVGAIMNYGLWIIIKVRYAYCGLLWRRLICH